MKRPSLILAAPLLLALLAAPALAAGPDDDSPFPTPESTWVKADWDAFSENLIVGLRSDNDGLRASALQMVILYGDRLDVREATFDVVRIFRDHDNERMRRLAAVSCTKLKSTWAVSFLRMSEPFERSAPMQHTIRALLAEHDAKEGKSREDLAKPERTLVAQDAEIR